MVRRAPLLALLLLAACSKDPPSADPKPPASASAAPSASASASASDVARDAAPPQAGPTVTDTFTTTVGDLTVTPIHHATLLLRVGGKAIYVDPVSEDASYEGLPKADFVFVTDVHGDHMDPKGLAKVQKEGTVIVAPPAVNEKMPAGVVMKNGDTHDFTLFEAEAVPMYNLVRGPAPGKRFHDKGRGNGYIFTFGKTRLYVSGDTECTPEMKALKNIDIAFVCMNLPYTMPPAEAAACVNAFKPKVLFPFHDKGSNLDELSTAVKPESKVEIRKRAWY